MHASSHAAYNVEDGRDLSVDYVELLDCNGELRLDLLAGRTDG